MIDGATVTLPLGEFDELRADSKEYRNIAPKIAACFEYEVKEYGEPEKCKTCKRVDPDCTKCKVFKESPPWEEILTVDTERLITFAKKKDLNGRENKYASDVKEMTVAEKKKRGADK